MKEQVHKGYHFCEWMMLALHRNYNLLLTSIWKYVAYRGSREYCEETLKVACEHQKRMDANLGGTEILQPLKHIYDKPPMTTHCREASPFIIRLIKIDKKSKIKHMGMPS